jgi:hypothetical protein
MHGRESRVARAWFCVEALTWLAVASDDRNAETSEAPIPTGCRLWWNKMYRRIQPTYASSVR